MLPQMFPLLMLSLGTTGEEQFLIRLFQQYHGLLFTAARQYLQSPQLADEAVSQCFVQLAKRIQTLQSLSEPQVSCYLYRSVKNCAIDLARSEEKHSALSAVMARDADRTAGDDVTPGVKMDERASMIADALERLSPADREIIRLFYYEELSQKEIAEKLQIRPSSVASRLHRARNRLGDILTDMGMPQLL